MPRHELRGVPPVFIVCDTCRIRMLGRRMLRKVLERLRGGSPPPNPVVSSGFHALTEIRRHYDSVGPQVLYVGDSVVERVSRNDHDKRTLGELVAAGLEPAVRVASISNSAFHPGVYAALFECLGRTASRPSFVILPVNMRCFSPQWDLRPAYQFRAEIEAFQRFARSGEMPASIAVSPVEDPKELATYRATAVQYPSSNLQRIGDFTALVDSRPQDDDGRRRRLEHIFKFHYTHPIRPSHRKLRALDMCCRRLVEMNIPALVYITPVNYQAGIRYAGASFLDEYRAGAEVVLSSLRPQQNVHVADWSTQLSSDDFVQPDIANEHLRLSGRLALSTLIVDAVNRLLP